MLPRNLARDDIERPGNDPNGAPYPWPPPGLSNADAYGSAKYEPNDPNGESRNLVRAYCTKNAHEERRTILYRFKVLADRIYRRLDSLKANNFKKLLAWEFNGPMTRGRGDLIAFYEDVALWNSEIKRLIFLRLRQKVQDNGRDEDRLASVAEMERRKDRDRPCNDEERAVGRIDASVVDAAFARLAVTPLRPGGRAGAKSHRA